MTKVVSAKYKVSRRLGKSIWGESKDAVHVKNYPPGQHGIGQKSKKSSDYGLHLRAKQIVKAHYGRITEKQFRNTFTFANKMKGNTAENFAGLMERRLDIVVYRLNFAPTIFSARQLVSHGHIRVNGKKVNIASQKLFVGDLIELKESSKQIPIYAASIEKQERAIPDYLSYGSTNLSGKFIRIPFIADIPYPFTADFRKIVEYYSH